VWRKFGKKNKKFGKKYGNKGLDNRYYKTRPTYIKGVKCKAY